jgi:predicted ATP-dependent endonuclease of OLD family
MFQAVRDGLKIKDRGKTAKEAYENVRKLPEFSTLPEWSTIGAAEDNLKLWESTNPNKCIRQRDEGQFFGFKEVAKGHLGKFTRFLFIPAVRDATDDSAEGRGSVLTELMDLVIRNALATNEELTKFKQETQERYSEIVDPASQTELTTLANKMTDTLKTFVPDSDVRVDLQWQPLSEVNIPLPQADVKLIEDGFSSAIPRTGHGLQRAFILTILQHLAQVQTTQEAAANTDAQDDSAHELQLPDLVLAIEEPELYQHPNRQRHLAKIFFDLASGTIPGVADKTQIFYATHSPLFVGIDRINQIRLFRKVSNALDEPKITSIVSTNLDKVAERIWEANGKPAERYTGTSLLPRLQSIMTPWMNEGFFSDIAVLVEGEDDRAAILGVSTAMGHNLESAGISVIPCGGKTNLDRPAIIFQQLNIPVYVVWDSDKNEESNGARPEDNHRLLRLMGQTITDWPCHIHENFACFENKLEFTLREEIGNVEFDQLLENCQNELYIPKKKHAVKNPVVIATVIQEAQKCGQKSTTLEEIITKILALRG